MTMIDIDATPVFLLLLSTVFVLVMLSGIIIIMYVYSHHIIANS